MSEAETWYRTRHDTIEAVKVTKYTDKSVWADHQFWGHCRQARRSYDRAICPTWREAHQFLEDVARQDLEVAQRNLKALSARLATIQAMKEPDNE